MRARGPQQGTAEQRRIQEKVKYTNNKAQTNDPSRADDDLEFDRRWLRQRVECGRACCFVALALENHDGHEEMGTLLICQASGIERAVGG